MNGDKSGKGIGLVAEQFQGIQILKTAVKGLQFAAELLRQGFVILLFGQTEQGFGVFQPADQFFPGFVTAFYTFQFAKGFLGIFTVVPEIRTSRFLFQRSGLGFQGICVKDPSKCPGFLSRYLLSEVLIHSES
jgi:hypothetical protein